MFQSGVDLKNYSNYKIGGRARYFYIAKNAEQIQKAVEKARKERIKIFILGGGTNLLISDEGFDGLVLKPEITKLKSHGVMGHEVMIKVGAGVSMTSLLHYCITKCLSGLGWAGGLPGTVGGAIRGNAGAFGGEIKDAVKEVVSLDISGKMPKITRRTNAECYFGYRDSIFKQNDGNEIILEAVFALTRGDKKAIRAGIEDKIRYRQEHQPLEYPNIGSIFKNVPLSRINTNKDSNTHEYYIGVNSGRNSRKLVIPVKTDPFLVVPAAYLIAEAGLKGVSCGGAMISPKHPNFIVNVLNARAGDVRKLLQLIKASVKEKFGIELEEEIIYV